MDVLKIKKNDERAIVPKRATTGSACMDLFALLDDSVMLNPGEHLLVHTGISIELPSPEYVALLFSRSGMGIKSGVTLSNSVGMIDSDYRGEVCVGLVNHGSTPYLLRDGDRIAQLMIIKHSSLPIEVVNELGSTERGTGGFGHTGTN